MCCYAIFPNAAPSLLRCRPLAAIIFERPARQTCLLARPSTNLPSALLLSPNHEKRDPREIKAGHSKTKLFLAVLRRNRKCEVYFLLVCAKLALEKLDVCTASECKRYRLLHKPNRLTHGFYVTACGHDMSIIIFI